MALVVTVNIFCMGIGSKLGISNYIYIYIYMLIPNIFLIYIYIYQHSEQNSFRVSSTC